MSLMDQSKDSGSGAGRYKNKFFKLNKALANIIEEFSLVKFHPLDSSEEDSISDLILVIDNVLQYGEDLEVKEPKEIDVEDEQDQYDEDE
jgi:hypothetical protein